MTKLIPKLTSKTIVIATGLLTLFYAIVPDVAEARGRGNGGSRDGFQFFNTLTFEVGADPNPFLDNYNHEFTNVNSEDPLSRFTISFDLTPLEQLPETDNTLIDRYIGILNSIVVNTIDVSGNASLEELRDILREDYNIWSAPFTGGMVTSSNPSTGLMNEEINGTFQFLFPEGGDLNNPAASTSEGFEDLSGFDSPNVFVGFLDFQSDQAINFAQIDINEEGSPFVDSGNQVFTTISQVFAFSDIPDSSTETTPEPSGILGLLAIAAFGTNRLIKRKNR